MSILSNTIRFIKRMNPSNKNPLDKSLATTMSAIILHIDIAGSTDLVRKDMVLAHERIQYLYYRIKNITALHNGNTLELRGDAAVIAFSTAYDAVCAALTLQHTNSLLNATRVGPIEPQLRVGISAGQIIVGNDTVTGESIIKAQRLEQLAESGEVLVDQHISDMLAENTDIAMEMYGVKVLKGFSNPTTIYRISKSSVRGIDQFSRHFSGIARNCARQLA